MPSPFQIADDLSFGKQGILEDDKDYVAFIINRHFSNIPDAVFQSNEMNLNSHLDVRLQHDYYLHSLRKQKRFAKWNKKDKKDEAVIEAIQRYYSYNVGRAKEALKLLTKDQIEYILAKVNPS